MFRKGKERNLFISKMTDLMNAANKGAEEIRPMTDEFFKKIMEESKIEWDESSVCRNINDIAETVLFIAESTRNHEKLNTEDISSIKKIIEEMIKIYNEALKSDSQDLSNKINCIKEMTGGMIFYKYDYLWKIIHRMSNSWKELCGRGLSPRVVEDYRKAFEYDRAAGEKMTEEEKLTDFMSVLDGKKMFVPVYEVKPVCFKVVDNDFEGEFVNTVENRYRDSYRLRQIGEEE